ncbi:unnamed protein product [Sympodiomycopsis kandeliae]
MEEYLQGIQQAISTSDLLALRYLFQIPSNVHQTIQADLNRIPASRWSPEAITRKISRSVPSDGGGGSIVAERLSQVIHNFLLYISRNPCVSELVSPASQYPISTWTQAHSNWSQLFTRSSTLFILPSSPLYFQSTFQYISSTFLTLSIKLDTLNKQNIKWPLLTDCTAKLAGPVRAAGTDRTLSSGDQTKRAAVMWLGNDCLRGYFKLNNLKLCETVLKSIREAISRNTEFEPEHLSDSSTPGESCYPMSERVRYRYYLGRIRISQGRIREAFGHLQWSFEHCHSRSFSHIRRILLHLLPCALILGYRPRESLVALIETNFPDVRELYLPLFSAYSKPDIPTFNSLLTTDLRRRESLRRLGVYLLLKEKTVIGMWRNLVKRCFLILHHQSQQQNSKAPPTLSLIQLHKAVQFLLPADQIEISREDLECIVSSLIDQGFIKGYTFHSKQILVLMRGEKMGFEPVSAVY